MKTFTTFLTEQKNLHLEHLEDELFNRGDAGVKEAINFITALTDMLQGESKKAVDVTVKWDGAPAVFAGINPENGKFFVATKSLFNKTPKINYTDEDIEANHSGGLVDKLKIALSQLSKLNIQGVLQGDMLFTNDVSTTNIDGKSYRAFTPNTITYAVPSDSDLAKVIDKAKLGIVFHTTYTGNTIADLKASFGADVSGLKKTNDVWFQDASYRDLSGRATLTARDTETLRGLIKGTERITKSNKRLIDDIVKSPMKDIIKIYLNANVRAGIDKGDVKGLAAFVKGRFATKIASLKTPKAQERVREEEAKNMAYLKKISRGLDQIFTAHNYLAKAKGIILGKLQALNTMPSFIRTDDGYRVTDPEGFVAIDSTGRAVKLVDRMEFSRANFTVSKDWTK